MLVKWFRNFTSYIKSNIKNIFVSLELKSFEELFISTYHFSHAFYFYFIITICSRRLKFVSTAEHNCVLCEVLQMNWEYKIFFF